MMKLLFTLLFSAIVLLGSTSIAIAQTEDTKPKLVEEFNNINTGYAKALIDSFIVELNNNPQTMAYIIVYGGSNNVCVSLKNPKTGKNELKSVRPLKQVKQLRKINFYRRYFVNTRGFDPSRLVLIDGGYMEKETTQFWLVSPGRDTPQPTPTVEEKDIKFREKGKIRRSDILGDC